VRSISVYVVYDSRSFPRVIVEFLGEEHDMAIVAVVGGCEQAVAAARALRPDMMLLGPMDAGLSGRETLSRLRALPRGVRIVVLTLLDTSEYRTAALAAGADAFDAKTDAGADRTPATRCAVSVRVP
jgi:DNA-binding NarL/FixJ family response regulator